MSGQDLSSDMLLLNRKATALCRADATAFDRITRSQSNDASFGVNGKSKGGLAEDG